MLTKKDSMHYDKGGKRAKENRLGQRFLECEEMNPVGECVKNCRLGLLSAFAL
jgi:hypothetical protein